MPQKSCLNLLSPIPFLLFFSDPLPSGFYRLCSIESTLVLVTEDLHVVNRILSRRFTCLHHSSLHSTAAYITVNCSLQLETPSLGFQDTNILLVFFHWLLLNFLLLIPLVLQNEMDPKAKSLSLPHLSSPQIYHSSPLHLSLIPTGIWLTLSPLHSLALIVTHLFCCVSSSNKSYSP